MRVWVVAIGFLMLTLPAFAHRQNTEAKEAQGNEARQGMPPRSSPNDYQAHAQAGNVTVAAEFMGHSVPRPEGSLSTDDYLVVETGLFGAPGEKINLEIDNFSLRVNGKKTALTSQPYGLVFSSLKDPDWVPPGGAEQAKSKTGINTGGQTDSGPPPPVHIPIELQRSMAQYVQKSALPEGERVLPKAGLIFFQYRGKRKGIHSLELIYNGPTGKATLALQP